MALDIRPREFRQFSVPFTGDVYEITGLSNGRQTVSITDTNTDPSRRRVGVFLLAVRPTAAATNPGIVNVGPDVTINTAGEVSFPIVVSNAASIESVLVLVH